MTGKERRKAIKQGLAIGVAVTGVVAITALALRSDVSVDKLKAAGATIVGVTALAFQA